MRRPRRRRSPACRASRCATACCGSTANGADRSSRRSSTRCRRTAGWSRTSPREPEPRDAVHLADRAGNSSDHRAPGRRAAAGVECLSWRLLRRDMRVARRELPFFLLRTALQPTAVRSSCSAISSRRWGFVRGGYTTRSCPGVARCRPRCRPCSRCRCPMVADFGWTRRDRGSPAGADPEPLVALEKIVIAGRAGVRRRRCSCCRRRGSSWARSPASTLVQRGAGAQRDAARRGHVLCARAADRLARSTRSRSA